MFSDTIFAANLVVVLFAVGMMQPWS